MRVIKSTICIFKKCVLKIFIFLSLFFITSCNKEKIEILSFKTTSIEIPDELSRAGAFYFSIGNKGFVGCGRNDTAVLNDVWEFDSETTKWGKKSNFIGIARVGAVATSCNGKAYAGLGYAPQLGDLQPQSYLRDFYEYVPETDSWKQLADYPTSFTDFCIIFSSNNKIFVSTGFDGTNFDNRTWMYDPTLNSWKEVGSIPIARVNAVCIENSRIFAGTGFYGNKNDWYEFDTIRNTWNEKSSMPDKGRLSAYSLVIQDKVFVAGGRHWGGDGDKRKDLSTIYQYHIENNSWTKAGDLPEIAREKAISFKFQNIAYFGLGENDSGLLPNFWKIEIE